MGRPKKNPTEEVKTEPIVEAVAEEPKKKELVLVKERGAFRIFRSEKEWMIKNDRDQVLAHCESLEEAEKLFRGFTCRH